MDLSTITVDDFKAFFRRDFPFMPSFECKPANELDYVQDSDIERAFLEAQVSFNQSLFSTEPMIKMGYLYVTAHYLVIDLRAASKGISGTGYAPVTGRTVGNVSENYTIPKAYLDNPVLSMYTQTPYGMKYLAMVLPLLVGNVGVVCGATLP